MIAKDILDEGNYSCVVVKNDELRHAVIGKGIKPLLNIYMENKEDLEGAIVADKVIRKSCSKYFKEFKSRRSICKNIKQKSFRCVKKG